MFLSLMWAMCAGMPSVQAQSYDKLWKKVEQAQEKSLPQTVIELADEIYRKGMSEQNAGQVLKAALCRDAYREYLTPDSLYKDLATLEQWAQKEENADDAEGQKLSATVTLKTGFVDGRSVRPLNA